MTKVSRSEVASKLAAKTNMKVADAEQVIKDLLDVVVEEFKAGNDVEFWGFGGFKVVEKTAGKGRNPRTGEEVTYPAKRVVRFYAGKNLQENLGK